MDPDTLAVHAGRPLGAGVPMNYGMTPSTSWRDSPDYTRCDGTPGWIALEEAVAALEGGRFCVSFASGMGAAAAVLHALQPRVVVLPRVAYLGVRSLVAHLVEQGSVERRAVDTADTAGIIAALPGSDLVWLETPSNPLLDVADLISVLPAAARAGARTCVDATFATPVSAVKPLALGATCVLHSGTKFIGGHSDALLGLVVTNDAAVYERLREARIDAGATPGTLEAYLGLRGLRTLPLRLQHASASAAQLVARLRTHTVVADVRYPGSGAMVSFIVHGGAPVADAVCAAAQLVVHATSLGGVETSFERRAKYAGDAHVDPGLIRMSVGLEAVDDLWRDLARALDAGLARHTMVVVSHVQHSTTRMRPDLPPAARVASGAVVAFETSDEAYEQQSQGVPLSRTAQPGALHIEHVNVVTGPLFVEGARVGDTLRVEVLDVHIRRCWSVWASSPDAATFGALAAKRAELSPNASVRELSIDRLRGVVRVSERLSVPLQPMIGCIGVASPLEAHWSTFVPTYPTGGNMDMREVRPGTTVLLPVAVDGALLFVGDLHAAMAAAEPTQVGFEAGGTATVRVSVVPGGAPPFPRLEMGDDLVFTAVHESSHDEAVQMALRYAYEHLLQGGLTPEEAFGYLTAQGDAFFGGPASKQALVRVPRDPSRLLQ